VNDVLRQEADLRPRCRISIEPIFPGIPKSAISARQCRAIICPIGSRILEGASLMRALKVVLQGAVLFGLLIVSFPAPANDTPFVGKLEAESKPGAEQKTARSAPPKDSPSETAADETAADEADVFSSPLADVVIEGNQAISTEEILKLIKTRPGEVFNRKQVKEDVRSLVSQRRFFDVETRIEKSEKGPVLVFRVREAPKTESPKTEGPKPEEKPRLEKVTYVGNHIRIEALMAGLNELIGPKVGDELSVINNRATANLMLDGYHEMGYAFVEVKLEKGDSPEDREVVFQIDEGPQVFLSRVGFSGNTSLPNWVLRLHAKTSTQTSWFSGCPFIRSEIGTDIAELKRIYRDRGFFDIQVEHRETFSKDRTEVGIEFVIDEGTRYKIRDIEFGGNKAISDAELRQGLIIHSNDYYDSRLVRTDGEKIEDKYRKIGAILPAAKELHRSIAGKPGVIDLVYSIQEGFFENSELVDVQGPEQQPGLVGRNPPAISRESALPMRKTVEPPGLRDFNRIVFIGVETFDVSEIRHRLAVDFDLIAAAHPDCSLFDYLKAIGVAISNGYRHGGFPDAVIQVLYNGTFEWVEVRVHEGSRWRCGDVQVTGAGSLPADQLIRALTDHSESSRTCWKIGGPVPFDEVTMLEMRAQLKAAFSDAGFFDPEFDLTIDRDPHGQRARLLVKIEEEGLCAAVRKIEVIGVKRDSADDVRKFLNIEAGAPCTRELLDRIERSLLQSGRYLHVAVTTESALGDGDGRKPHDVKIQLREYAEAVPITQELPAAEQALLKLGEWAKRWARGETGDDVVITATSAADGAQAASNPPNAAQAVPHAGLQLDFRMVVRPRIGQTVTWEVTREGGEKLLESLFVAGPHEVVFASQRRKAKLVLPISTKDKVALEFYGTEVPVDQVSEDKRQFRLNLGLKWNTRSRGYPNPFEVDPHFTAAFLTSLTHFDNPSCIVREGICEIASDSLTIRIDQTTGRLIECRIPMGENNESVTIRSERNAYEAERQNLDGVLATCAPTYAAGSPWKSIVEFLMDEYLHVASQVGTEDRIQPYRALRKVIGAWDTPGIGELYGVLDYPINDANPFAIPSPRGGPLSADSTERGSSWRKQTAAGIILPIYRHLVPERGWMWPAGRDGVLSWAEDAQVPIASFRAAPLSAKTGPLGELCLGWIDKLGGLNLVRKIASREGLQRLSAEALSNDYWPALTDESWLGRWILSLAEAVRLLDEQEIQSLVSLLPDDDLLPREALAKSLVLLTTDREIPVDEVLPKVLDRFWEEGLRGTVRSALTKVAPAQLFKRLPKRQDAAVVPAGGEIDMGVEVDGDEDILVPVDQEPRPTEPRRLESPAIPDQGFFPDGEPSVDEIPDLIP
jgi:outer membrane protein assembly factor BamA